MAEKQRETFLKKFNVNGETVERLVTLNVIKEFDEYGNTLYHYFHGEEERHEYEVSETDNPPGGHHFHKKSNDGTEEWFELDAKNRFVHGKKSDGKEEWWEYDEKGNITFVKNGNNIEVMSECDEKGNKIHGKDFFGGEYWNEYKYDENDRIIYTKEKSGNRQKEVWYDRDENGNIVHERNSDGEETWYDLDENGREVHGRRTKDGEKDGEWWYKRDERGNIIYTIDSQGREEWSSFDENGTHRFWRTMHPVLRSEMIDEYNELGKLTYSYMKDISVDENGIEKETVMEDWYDYDEAGREIHSRCSNGREYWYEYELYADGSLKKETIYGAAENLDLK